MAMIVCPICATRYRVADSQLSKASRLKCKKCKTVFPVSDNIRADDAPQENIPAELPPAGPSPQETSASHTLNLSDIGLDMGVADQDMSNAPTLDFSFSANIPSDTPSESEELHDHIASGSQEDQGQLQVGMGNLSFQPGGDGESTLSMDHNLDFSFTAAIPEAAPEGEEAPPAEEGEPAGNQELSLENLSLGDLPEESTMTMPTGAGETLFSEPGANLFQETVPAEPPPAEVEAPADVFGGDLPQAGVHIGFSAETQGAKSGPVVAPDEDFSDVEKALDALADGSFEKEIKKRKAQATRGQRLKLIGAGIGLAVLVALGGLWSLLPSAHEKLAKRYDKLVSQPEIAPQDVVDLFLDASAQQDQEMIQKVSVMKDLLPISSGEVLSVGEEYDATPPVNLGEEIAALKAEIEALKKTNADIEKKWQEESKVNLTPELINTNIQELLRKQQNLQAEYKAKEAESAEKMVNLQQQISEAKKDLEENRRRAQETIDDTSPTGKAMYTASVRNQQSLSKKIGELEDMLAVEKPAHAKRMQTIDAEYNPRFDAFEKELKQQQALYEKARLLQDQQNSPLVLLDKQMKQVKAELTEKEEMLQAKEAGLKMVVDFFKRDAQRQQVEQQRDKALFAHVSKNVVVSVKLRGGSKQKIPIMLTRYRAQIGEQTIQGDWVVEKVLQP